MVMSLRKGKAYKPLSLDKLPVLDKYTTVVCCDYCCSCKTRAFLKSVLSLMVDECVIWALSELHDVGACATKNKALACGSGCD